MEIFESRTGNYFPDTIIFYFSNPYVYSWWNSII